jgi:hypothetical protein
MGMYDIPEESQSHQIPPYQQLSKQEWGKIFFKFFQRALGNHQGFMFF